MNSADNCSSGQDRGQVRVYAMKDAAVFFRTKEALGGLSNMAAGYPLVINGVRIGSSEALYQACRFPHLPDVQEEIIREASPFNAKVASYEWRGDSRSDWMRVRVNVMRWCLRAKALQNQNSFIPLLLSTESRPIVELSSRDDFWGALKEKDGALVGKNVLGRLLMELREEVRRGSFDVDELKPLPINDFLLLSQPITTIASSDAEAESQQPRLC